MELQTWHQDGYCDLQSLKNSTKPLFPTKKHEMYTKSSIQGPQLETSGCWFCYLGGERPSWIYPKCGFRVLQNLNPMIL